MFTFAWPFLMPMLRHALTAAGAALVAKGYADEGLVEQIVGGVIAAASVGWMTVEKLLAKRPAETAR